MPTPLFVGTTTFRDISIEEVHNRGGLDSVTITRRGRSTLLATESALWTKGISHDSYPNMSLETKSVSDRGALCDVVLNFIGFISADTPENGLIDISDDIALQSVSLTSSGGDNVQYSYHGQSTTYRWIYRGTVQPQRPRFQAILPTELPTNYLFNPFPASFSGSTSSAFQIRGRLTQFNRTRLSPHMWAVIESWSMMVEPVA